MSKEEGAPPNRICPQCKRLLDATWKACPYCGTSLISNVCPQCKRLLDATWKACPYCGRNLIRQERMVRTQPPEPRHYDYDIVDEPSVAWYLAPLLFGIVGGLIGYILIEDRDKDMATKLLLFGLIWNIFLFIIGYIWIISLRY